MATNFLPLQLAANRMVVNVDAADQLAFPIRAGLRYYLTLFIPAYYLSNQFTAMVEFDGSEMPPEAVAGGTIYRGAFFEIQDQLDSLLKRNAPTFGQTGISLCDGLTMPYYVACRVENNDVVVSQKVLPVQYAIKAGIAERDFAANRNTFFTDFMGAGGRFLTWTDDQKTVHPSQPEFLYWVANGMPAPTELRLRCEVYTVEPQEARDVFTAAVLTSVTPMSVYCLAVGPAALGLAKRSGTPAEYVVWLEDQNGNALTAGRSYRLDTTYRRNVRFIVFANSLGGFDTLYLTGAGEESVKVSRNISDRFPAYSFDPQYAEQVINQTSGERQLTVNTGWLTPAGRTCLQELLLTKEAYMVTDRAFLPLVPMTDSLTLASDDEEGVIGRTLAFRYTNPEGNFSRLPARTTTLSRATGWRPKSVACQVDANGKRTGKRVVSMLEKYYLDDNSRVVEAPLKTNTPGTEGFIPPDLSSDCKVTPFLSAAISRATSFSRNDCGNGQVGGPATVSIAAGTYGSELSQADADAKAEAAFQRSNTQEFTNANGSCNAAPELYEWAVPAGYWHSRAMLPAKTDITFRDENQYPIYGNSYMVQGNGNPKTYPYGSNDLDFPTAGWTFCNIRVYGTPGSAKRLRVYRNGVLVKATDMVMNPDGFEQPDWLPAGFGFASGDKVYIRVEDL